SRMWSSEAVSWPSGSKRIVRSARCSFSLGRTAKRPQPATASRATTLKKDRQATRHLLRGPGFALVEEDPVPVVAAHRDALAQRDLEAAARVERELGLVLEREGVGLGHAVLDADAGVEVRPDGRAGDQAQRPAQAAHERLVLRLRALAEVALDRDVRIEE